MGITKMFENFHQAKVQTTDPEVSINLRYGEVAHPVFFPMATL